MSHTIQLPEDVYAAIAAYAARHGQTPEAAIQAWARALPEREAETPRCPPAMIPLMTRSPNS